MTEANIENMRAAADRASALLKVMGHKDRLMILCHLADGEKSVGELVALLCIPQSSLSQHLARMRAERLVETRRESQSVYYRLADGEVRIVIGSLYEAFCTADA